MSTTLQNDTVMEYVRSIFLLFILFLLTSLFCWIANALILYNPLCGAGLILLGIMGVVLAADAIGSILFP